MKMVFYDSESAFSVALSLSRKKHTQLILSWFYYLWGHKSNIKISRIMSHYILKTDIVYDPTWMDNYSVRYEKLWQNSIFSRVTSGFSEVGRFLPKYLLLFQYFPDVTIFTLMTTTRDRYDLIVTRCTWVEIESNHTEFIWFYDSFDLRLKMVRVLAGNA